MSSVCQKHPFLLGLYSKVVYGNDFRGRTLVTCVQLLPRLKALRVTLENLKWKNIYWRNTVLCESVASFKGPACIIEAVEN